MDEYHIGSLDFDSKNRLAILNILNGVTLYYDDYTPEGLRNYIKCYSNDGVFILKIPDKAPQYVYKKPKQGETGMDEFFAPRIQAFMDNGVQCRHNFTNKVVIKQSKDSAETRLNLIFIKNQRYTEKNGSLTTTLTVLMSAQYDISLVKQGRSWFIKKMVANVDDTFT